MTKSYEIPPVPNWNDDAEQTVITAVANTVFELAECDLFTASVSLPNSCFGTDNVNAILRKAARNFWNHRTDYGFRNAQSARYFAVNHAAECVLDAIVSHLTSKENFLSEAVRKQVLCYGEDLKTHVQALPTDDMYNMKHSHGWELNPGEETGISRLLSLADQYFDAAYKVLAAEEAHLPTECQGKKNADGLISILNKTIEQHVLDFRYCDSRAIEELGPRLAADKLATVLKLWLRPDSGQLSEEVNAQIALFCNDIRFAVTHTLPNV